MRRAIVTAVAVLFMAIGATAQNKDQEHDHSMMVMSPEAQQEHLAHLRALVASGSSHGPVIPQPEGVTAAATKAVAITAQRFFFSPTAFTVNQGDVVTITLSVPSSDGAAAHGLLMDTYIGSGFDVLKGKSGSVTFTATTKGSFQFICDVPSCGSGHTAMSGNMTVQAVSNPAPTISGIAPATGSVNGGTIVTVSGTGFSSNATVKFGGVSATNVNVPNSTSITASAPAHAAGKVDVVVTNSDGQFATLDQGFTYAVPPPTITNVSPATGSTVGGTSIAITGTNFQSGATVTIGGVPATDVTFVSATSITARTPLGPATEQLNVDVVVTNPDNTKATATSAFTYSVPPLAVVSVTPNITVPLGTSGAGPVVVTIFGAGFTTALSSSVAVGGVAATSVQVIDPVTLRATFAARAAGTSDVVVTVGGTSVTLKNGFSWQNPPLKHRAVKH